MKVHMHTKFCFICLFTFIFHHCNHCHAHKHDHKITSEENNIHSDYQISKEPYLQNGAAELLTSQTSSPEAEHEQRFYIEKLFARYGENGRLSYHGLEKLLNSLGLGEVKVVEIGHEDLGHDPVSHLDVLDVQEGRHVHLHDHSSHTEAENETKNAVSTKEYNACKENKASLPVEPKLSHSPHLHNHTHKGTNHTRNHSHHGHSGTVSQLDHGGQIEPVNSTDITREHPEKKLHKHKKKKKGTKSSEPTTDSAFVSERDEYNHVYKPEHSLDVGHLRDREDTENFELDGHAQMLEDRQHNTRKREAPDNHIGMKGHVFPQATKQHSEDVHKHDECLNVTQLLNYYGLNIDSPISPDQFSYLCPALLYQIENRFCIKHFTDLHMEPVETIEKNKDAASVWLYGFFSITVISLLSLLGVILIPIINQGCFKFLLNFLVAIAVGTLSGDALLHLLPHSQGGHDHGSEESGHKHSKDPGEEKEFLVEYDRVMKGLVALGGIYLLFIVEHCLRMFKHYNDQRGIKGRVRRKPKVDESTVGRKLSDHKLNRRSDAEWLQLKPLAGTEDLSATEGQRLNETEMTYVDSLQSPVKVFVAIDDDVIPHNNKDVSYDDDHNMDDGQYENHTEEVASKKHNHGKHSHHSHGHCHSGKDMKDRGISSIAWMVIMGDGMHNFSDGLAIGAAFSAGLTGGISTSVAVFCHELPHELGDFAVLLKAGMTVKQAIVYNVLSAMMAYIGMCIGTAVGQYANNITLWIFAITAGMFLYVALVDMLPEMLHGDGENEEHGHCPVGQFILQNLGLLLGFAIMLVIALYEDKIVLDLNF
ncbi:PREDICTED: zinc transporter ZIP10 [Nanorana parkeri]|uniref:zinc transporter ZIP10 n=1 Tax=Nanorana parkeri TaxID=125878 RepID=UPI0008547FB6|nr:PREDICTED: zinc transporter ZIP10 [Nanorana parkeri]